MRISDWSSDVCSSDLYEIPSVRYLVGSFQRDSVASDLVSPKLVKGPDVFCEIIRQAMDLGAPVHVVLAGPRRTWIRRRLQALRVPYTFVGTTTANDREDLAANTLPREVLNELY